MPVYNRTRGSTTRLQHSHRTSSGGSSKVGLNNLALTQKDPAQPTKQQNIKRAGHSASELHQGKQHYRAAHLSRNQRVRSKDQISVAQRHSDAPASSRGKQQECQPQRPNFSIAHSDEMTDSDDEWVSSESGAVTPQTNADLEQRDERELRQTDARGRGTPPAGSSKINGDGNGINGYGNGDRALLTIANEQEGATTPRAEVIDMGLTRSETARPDAAAPAGNGISLRPRQNQGQQRQDMKPGMEPPPAARVQALSSPATPVSVSPPTPDQQPAKDITLVRLAHSETPSPTQLRQKAAAVTASGSRRSALMQHSSSQAHGERRTEVHNPPHPLIRGQSYHGAALRPARLAPLTIKSEAARAHLTTSPSSALAPNRAESPTFVYTNSPSDASTGSGDRVPSRKGSISSLHSIATLPAPTSRRFASSGPQQANRTRTLSTLSTSSSSAALNALSSIPSISRPASPPLVVRFPPDPRTERRGLEVGMATNVKGPHESFLPANYLKGHKTMRIKYNPLADSWERVMRAKHGLPPHPQGR